MAVVSDVSRAKALERTRGSSLPYGRQWLPDGQWGTAAGPDELVESFGAEEYWRYLGMVQNGEGEIEGMLEAVEAEVREEAAVLGRKRTQPLNCKENAALNVGARRRRRLNAEILGGGPAIFFGFCAPRRRG
jgi:hypothetical protein